MSSGFSISDALSFGWATFKQRVGLFLGLIFVSALIMIILSVIQSVVAERAPFIAFIFSLLAMVASAVIALGWARIALKAYDGAEPEIGDMISEPIDIAKMIGAMILVQVAVGIGFLLLIVPGIFLAVRLYFYSFAVAEGLGPIEAIQRSWDMTRGQFWKLFGFMFVSWLVLMAGAIAFGIGLLVAGPVVGLAFAYVYRRLPAPEVAPGPAFAA